MITRITSGGVGLDLKVNRELYGKIKDFDFVKKYIPKAKLSPPQDKFHSREGCILEIMENKEIEKPNFHFEKGCGILECCLGKNVDLYDIVTVIEYCLEYVRQSNGIYCLHGSAVSKKDKGVLIIGPMSGLGKTTLAVNLCSRHDFKFIGDEKILVNREFKIVGGIKVLTYNKKLLQKSIGKKFKNKPVSQLEKLINLEKQIVPVKLVIQPAVVLDARVMEMEKWSSLKANFHLFEEMSRKIRGVSRRIHKFSIPLESIDTPGLAFRRSRFAHLFSKKATFVSLIGGLTPVTEEIIKLSVSG